MKHSDLFTEFLKDTVNLNTTRLDTLEASTIAIKDFVAASGWAPEISAWMAQGSWAHGTIIKPVDQGEFDADLLVFVHPVEGWDAASYIEQLYLIFRSHGTYRDKVRRWSHCVTITYANDKQVDVAPVVVNRGGFQRLEVCNRNANKFELTEPRRYTEWLIQRNALSRSNSFRKVTRLVKYLRDIKTTFSCSSILLTTLLGNQIHDADAHGHAFADVPTALRTLFGRLDDWLQLRPWKPIVSNPFLPSEDFAAGWTNAQYDNFRQVIARYRGWIDDAFLEASRYESLAKWRRVFGDDFAAGVVVETARAVSQAARDALNEGVSAAALFAHSPGADLVALVKQQGERALPPGFDALPHMRRPSWRPADGPPLAARVDAVAYRSRGLGRIGPVRSLEPLPKGRWLRFTARTSAGAPLPARDYLVQWRITNTDEAASRARQLRGDFYDPEADNDRWEHTGYRGVHLAEAFILDRRTRELIGYGGPFRVVVE